MRLPASKFANRRLALARSPLTDFYDCISLALPALCVLCAPVRRLWLGCWLSGFSPPHRHIARHRAPQRCIHVSIGHRQQTFVSGLAARLPWYSIRRPRAVPGRRKQWREEVNGPSWPLDRGRSRYQWLRSEVSRPSGRILAPWELPPARVWRLIGPLPHTVHSRYTTQQLLPARRTSHIRSPGPSSTNSFYINPSQPVRVRHRREEHEGPAQKDHETSTRRTFSPKLGIHQDSIQYAISTIHKRSQPPYVSGLYRPTVITVGLAVRGDGASACVELREQGSSFRSLPEAFNPVSLHINLVATRYRRGTEPLPSSPAHLLFCDPPPVYLTRSATSFQSGAPVRKVTVLT